MKQYLIRLAISILEMHSEAFTSLSFLIMSCTSVNSELVIPTDLTCNYLLGLHVNDFVNIDDANDLLLPLSLPVAREASKSSYWSSRDFFDAEVTKVTNKPILTCYLPYLI